LSPAPPRSRSGELCVFCVTVITGNLATFLFAVGATLTEVTDETTSLLAPVALRFFS
jgi:hypothetical protein